MFSKARALKCRGFTQQPKNYKRAHFRPRRFKHHQDSTRRYPERHEKSENGSGSRKKTARNFGPPTLPGGFTLRGLGAPPLWPHLSALHFFGVGSTLGGPEVVVLQYKRFGKEVRSNTWSPRVTRIRGRRQRVYLAREQARVDARNQEQSSSSSHQRAVSLSVLVTAICREASKPQ